MGFYGNITSTSRTQFQFDKTYPNRATMDNNVALDGVYIGRYVLIEYDTQFGANWCMVVYAKTVNNVLRFYSSPDASEASRYRYGEGNFTKGKYIRVPATHTTAEGTKIIYNLDSPNIKQDTIYKITGNNGTDILVSKISELQGIPYNENYTVDLERYGPSRGYDSTVWQKVYTDGTERYVMIAELNTVVPTFDVVADAPTASPLAPHFDGDSSNVYYKLHWQPSWGLRVKSAYKNLLIQPINEAGASDGTPPVPASEIMEKSLPSDETVVWRTDGFDKTQSDPAKRYKNYIYKFLNKNTETPNGAWVEDTENKITDDHKIPAAIYYNKSGFNPRIISYSDKDIQDAITIEPTGRSGHSYNAHDGSYTKTVQPDTQELSIILPSIGNSVASMWDVVYGDKAMNNNTNVRDTSMKWTMHGSIKPKNQGLRLITTDENGYLVHPEKMSTVAGAVNSMHDLMGMIIQEVDTDKEPAANKADKYIFYDKKKGKFYRKHKGATYTAFSGSNTSGHQFFERIMLETDVASFLNNCYYRENTAIEGKYNYIKETQYNEGLNGKYYQINSTTPVSFNSSFKEQQKNIYERYDTEDKGIYYIPTKDEVFVEEKINNYRYIQQENIRALPVNTFIYSAGRPFINTTILIIESATKAEKPTYADFNRSVLYELQADGKYTQAKYPGSSFSPSKTYYTLTFRSATDDEIGILIGRSQFFSILTEQIETESTVIIEVSYTAVSNITSDNFVAGLYFYFDNDLKEYVLALEYQENTQYYSEHKQLTTETISFIPPEHVKAANVIHFQYNRYYHIVKNMDNGIEYHLISNLGELATKPGPYVEILQSDINNTLEGFYVPNMYWYKISSGSLKDSYVLDDSLEYVKDREYYRSLEAVLKPMNGTQAVYEPGKYYYLLGNSYQIDFNLTPINIAHYKKNGLYVLNDSAGRFAKYSEWNYKIVSIPSGITLGYKSDVWEYQELPEFAQGQNSLHGLLLRIHKLLEFNDISTRERTTVQGVLNRINDLSNTIGELEANSTVMTDEFGRLITGNVLNTTLNTSVATVDDNIELGPADSVMTALIKLENRIKKLEEKIL